MLWRSLGLGLYLLSISWSRNKRVCFSELLNHVADSARLSVGRHVPSSQRSEWLHRTLNVQKSRSVDLQCSSGFRLSCSGSFPTFLSTYCDSGILGSPVWSGVIICHSFIEATIILTCSSWKGFSQPLNWDQVKIKCWNWDLSCKVTHKHDNSFLTAAFLFSRSSRTLQ